MNSLKNITNLFPNTSIAVIGDLCLDMYYFLTDSRGEISVETGLKTRSVSQFKFEAGGGGNVAINLKTLGAAGVDVYGVIGEDPFGVNLKTILKKADINCDFIQMQKQEWNTHVYHKTYINGVEEPRNDVGNFNKVNSRIVDLLLKDIESNINKYQTIIINEQIIHGYHDQRFQKGLSGLISKYEDKCLWITDCRHLNNIYNKTIRKLNREEAVSLFNEYHKNQTVLPDDKNLTKWLYSHWKKPVVITLGENGAIAADTEGEIIELPGINIVGQIDTVGAGDAFLSGLALTLASGHTLKEAVNIGNLSASVSVTKLYETGHPSTDDLLKSGISPDYRYNPQLAGDPRAAEYYKDSSIELINLGKTGFPKIVIFDHDGTISTLRQGWEPIMKEISIQAILGDSFNTAPRDEYRKVESAVVEMIEKTTGIQTIIQMEHLREMVISFGHVPPEKIKTVQEYKDSYNTKLLEMVSERVKLFQKGLLDLNDLTIKGAIDFLEILKAGGTKIFLASGTDQNDVRNEAGILGYDGFFDGGIFGSVGDVSCDPKRAVIENIVKMLPAGINPEECWVFGDGPVEMREAVKRSFTRIGVVSDEKRRFGINPDKRSRLILGGAQALIPDFSWIYSLSQYAGWGI